MKWTGLNRLMRLFATVLLLSLGMLSFGHAATFSAKRGINMDIWVYWPGRDKWADEKVMLPFPEWRQHVTAEELAQIKADGFDFVRMPVDPAPFLVSESADLRQKLLASVLDSAQAINAAGLKVVVDMHLIGADQVGTMGSVMSDPAQFDRYLELVREVGKLLAQQDPAMVAFELMNEPVVDCETGENRWPEMQGKLYAAARASATKLTLVMTGACWGSGEKLAQIDPSVVADDNVIWTFHFYEPFLLSSQGASWAGDLVQYVTGLPYPTSALPRVELDAALAAVRQKIRDEAPLLRRMGMIAYLDEQMALIDTDEKLLTSMAKPFDVVVAWADKHGIKRENILLGEFGMITQDYGKPFITPPAWRAAYTRDVIKLAEDRGFAWSIWGYGGSFGLYDAFDGNKADPGPLNVIRALSPVQTLGN